MVLSWIKNKKVFSPTALHRKKESPLQRYFSSWRVPPLYHKPPHDPVEQLTIWNSLLSFPTPFVRMWGNAGKGLLSTSSPPPASTSCSTSEIPSVDRITWRCVSSFPFRGTPPCFSPHEPHRKRRLTAFNPWKKRPGGGIGGQLHGRPQMVHPHHFRHAYRRQNPDDPTRLLSPHHVLLKRCPLCKRTKYVPLSEKDYFHTCCEGQVMRLWTNMRNVMNSEHKLIQAVRQWDVENERPWSNPHRPKPKGRSKLKKR